MRMKNILAAIAVCLAALTVATAAFAATTTYAGPKQWYPGEGAGSSYNRWWHGNHFSTNGSGFDKVVTFIDNVSYSWHNTVRNRSGSTETGSPSGLVTKGHCRAYDGYFWGSCWLHH